MTIDLLCADPKEIPAIWPYASGLIRSALEQTDLSSFEETEKQILSGDQLLWLAISDHIEAAATTHLSNNVCTIVACSGHNRERWLPLFSRIETYAKNEGCRCIRIFGRRGWERVLTGYRVEHVVLEKVLT